MNKTAVFPCTKCGECCRHIDRVPQLAQFDPGNGICIHLVGNLCDIYEDRPEICSVSQMYRRYYSTQFSISEFYKLNEEACREIQTLTIKKV